MAGKVSTRSSLVGLRCFVHFPLINLVLEWDHTTKAAITEVAAVFLLIRNNVHSRLVSKNIKRSPGELSGVVRNSSSIVIQQLNAAAFIDRLLGVATAWSRSKY